ncbi:hypothetical protein CB1_000188013 [Camelus ferus]|nr:hypothetical protein CB1_000188013 [Camelus ferus]
MQLSPPARDAGLQPEDAWAALEGISYSEYREESSSRKQLLQLMEENKHLLNVDEYLFRSWFSLLPLSSLVHYMNDLIDFSSRFPPRVLDCLLGTYYRFQGLREIYNRNSENIESILRVLSHLLDSYQDKIIKLKPLVLSFSELLAALRPCCVLLTPSGGGHGSSSVEGLPGGEAGLPLLSLPGSFDGGVPAEDLPAMLPTQSEPEALWDMKGRMFRSWHSSDPFTYAEEIKVWRRLVEIPFPKEHGWKESLLGDLEGRLKQEKPLSQILAFCSSKWDAAGGEDSVSKCFEKCVIEAVSLVCQSQTSILEKIAYDDWRKCGTLVSAVITKSWPRNGGELVDNLDEILTHLLTGPDIKHLFKLYGTNEKIIANMTEEAKKLMSTADSVFTKVTSDLINGTILVGQLELIIKHINRFLDIWQLNSKCLSDQKKNTMKEVLGLREKELLALKREESHVNCLLKLCARVKDLIRGDLPKL